MEESKQIPPLECAVYPLGTCGAYKYVVVCAFLVSDGSPRLILSRHRRRHTWETQGGHIEPGETPLMAARRELYEESGITDADIVPVCDYKGSRGERFAYGVVFAAHVRTLGVLPASEMAEVRVFDEMPAAASLTYPLVTPRLFREAGWRDDHSPLPSPWSSHTSLPIPPAIGRTDPEKRAAYRAELLVHPCLTYLFGELTDRCNLACLHCGSECSAANAHYMDADLFIRTLQTVAEDFDPHRVMICLTGGEPLLHPEFERIAKAIVELGFPWGMTSNGTLIDATMARHLRELRMRTISLSIDGLRDTHNWFRGAKGDNYQKTVDAIRALQAEGFDVQVTTVVHQKNLCELEDLYRDMLALGLSSWRVINIEPIGRALERGDLSLAPDEMRYMLDFIRRKRAETPKTGMDVCFGCSHYLGDAYEREVRDHCFMCLSGIKVASILWNGDIYSCLDIERRPELVQGNVARDRFSAVWYERFEAFRTDRTACSETCRNCPDRPYCNGDSTHTWDFDRCKPRFCIKDCRGNGEDEEHDPRGENGRLL